ncbi:hypothetical protein GCM10007415_15570 [Parapedobacter pyrenivorans]|uniref:Uncharacterized protein n=1 Tax=Parapedobacter pyrenivorans TaxID=1305674 RepID=A0A917M7W6_9SPHI|nr:hypothetical protein [Parapedobacter pyrenivorans]GGG83399.1 hypothetical protein GCM10007415_15570 [Parapedobacter pyrenivorans]
MKTCQIVFIGVVLWVFPLSIIAQDFSDLKRQKPIGFNGGLELRGIYYNANGIANRREPFTYLLSGSPTISLYGWSIPFSFMISKDERSFRQPFNQFGMSPTYKWITLHAGYRNVTFSPYTLAGHTMLGGGFEINPGKLRAGFMYGRLNRATVIDTTTQSLVPFSFSRKGMAAKLGYGTETNHFDLNFLHAKDDSTSGPGIPLHDSTRVLAAANTVLGYSMKFLLFKKLSIESDGAASIYTRDLNSPITFDSIADPMLKRLKGLLDVNGSTEWFLAFNAGIGYREKNYGIKVNYRRIEPDFKTMGAYFFANDVENITINPNFTLPNGKLRVNASLGIQQDNVNLQKEATNKRIIGAGTIGAEITDQLGVDINYSNFSNNQRPNTLRFADSLKIVQTTQTLNIMPRYTVVSEHIVHMVMLSVNLSGMKDYNSYFEQDAANRDINTSQYLMNYNLSFPAKLLSVFASVSYTAMEGAGTETSYSGVTLGGNYSLAKQQLQAGVNTSLMQGKTPTGKSMIINGSLNLNYRINGWQSIRASFFLTNNNPGSVVTGINPAFTETRGELAYQINFGL